MSLLEEIRDLGWTVTAFSRLCDGISPHTLKKIDQDRPVRPDLKAKVRRALASLKDGKLKAS